MEPMGRDAGRALVTDMGENAEPARVEAGGVMMRRIGIWMRRIGMRKMGGDELINL